MQREAKLYRKQFKIDDSIDYDAVVNSPLKTVKSVPEFGFVDQHHIVTAPILKETIDDKLLRLYTQFMDFK